MFSEDMDIVGTLFTVVVIGIILLSVLSFTLFIRRLMATH